MSDHLKAATEYLALAEKDSPGNPADMVQLSIAHSLAGLLRHVTEQGTGDGDWMDAVAASGQTVPTDDMPSRDRTCVLCGRTGPRRFEATPAGWICSHYGQCAVRREENAA